ncbi:MAG: hypothetical protein JRD05_00645 [Deltaproteobacteria bacterium]|nr:hypothetical protein [Deltaproteobacteria bacterium]
MEILQELAATILPTIITMLSGLFSWGMVELTKYIRTKTKNEAINDAVSHICHTVDTTVKEIAQTTAKEYKKSRGKLSFEATQRLKALAVSKVKAQIPAAINKIAGMAVNDVGNFIEAKIEKAVLELKNR